MRLQELWRCCKADPGMYLIRQPMVESTKCNRHTSLHTPSVGIMEILVLNLIAGLVVVSRIWKATRDTKPPNGKGHELDKHCRDGCSRADLSRAGLHISMGA